MVCDSYDEAPVFFVLVHEADWEPPEHYVAGAGQVRTSAVWERAYPLSGSLDGREEIRSECGSRLRVLRGDLKKLRASSRKELNFVH